MADASRPEQLEREAFLAVVKSAIAKNQAKQPLSPKESNAWKRFELEEDERRGRRFVAAVPKRIYAQWSGRQQKILNDQHDLYGIPLRGATINLPDVVAWLHDFLAQYKHDLAPLVKGGSAIDRTPTLKEQLQAEQVALYRKKNELLEEEIASVRAQSLPAAEVHKAHVQLAAVLRGAGERLQKQFGDEAASILAVALDDFESMIHDLVEPKTSDAAA